MTVILDQNHAYVQPKENGPVYKVPLIEDPHAEGKEAIRRALDLLFFIWTITMNASQQTKGNEPCRP